MSLRVQRVPSVKYKLLTAAVAAFALVAQPMYGVLAGYVASAAAPKVVNTTTDEEFDTIQQAINDTDTVNGHIITVPAGTYAENVTIAKSLTLRGAQAGNDARTRTIDAAGESIINGGTGVAVRISAPNVTIDGFQVIQTRSGSSVLGAHAVEMSSSYAGITLQNNIVARTGDGSAMHLYGGQNITVQKNYFTDTANNGLVMRNGNVTGATNQKIIDNKFINIRAMTGGAIVVYGQSGLEIARNNITASFSGISIGATGAAHYIMNGINVHDNNVNIVLDQTQPNTYRHAILVEGNGAGISIKNNNLEQSGVPPVATTRYALVRVSYDGTATTDTNIVNLVISENNLKSNVTDRYILVGQNVTNQIDASKNWWGSQASPASKVTSPTATVVSSPWLCQPYDQDSRVSDGGSCAVQPAKPSHVSPAADASVNTNDFYFDWTDVQGAVSYELQNSQSSAVDATGSFQNVQWTGDYQKVQPTESQARSVGANGTWYWQVRSVDASGNKSDWTQPWKVTIDMQKPDAPVFSVAGLASGAVIKQDSVSASWTKPSDDTEEYEYQYWNDIAGNLWKETNPWSTKLSAQSRDGGFTEGEGTHFMRVRAIDTAGNKSDWSNTFVVTHDKTKATTAISSAIQTGDVVKVTGSVNDANLNYYYCYLTTNQTITVNGITYTNGQEVRLGADTSNPAHSSRNAACNTTWANGRTSITGELGGFNIAGVPTGSYTVNLVAHDKATNNNASDPTQYTFDIDKTAPSASVNVTTSNNVATATLSGISESIKGVAGWTQVGGTWTREHNANGSYFVTIEDLAGNTKTISYSVNSIDDVPPAVTVTGVSRNNNGTYTITGTTSDASDNVTVSINGAPALPANVTGVTWQYVTQQLVDGPYTVAVTSVDEFGNSGSLSPVYAFTATAPFLGGSGLDEESELVIRDLSGAPGAGPAGTPPQTFAAATGVTGEDNDQNDSAILGAQTSKQPAAAAPAIEATESGWKIFGLAWYWWLLILAAIAAAWWAIAGYRRRQDEA